MNVLFLIFSFLFLCFSIFIFYNFVKNKKNKSNLRFLKIISILGLISFVNFVLFFLWGFGFVDYAFADFQYLFLFEVFFQLVVFFRIIYLFSRNKKILPLFLIYCFFSVLFFIFLKNSFIFFYSLSFFVALLLFVEIVFRRDEYRFVGLGGIFYSLISLILVFFNFFNFVSVYFVVFVLSFLFFVFVSLILRDLDKYPVVAGVEREESRSKYLSMLGHLIFIVVFVNFVFIGTIAVHELGHLGMSSFYDCEYERIVFENGLFHTEIFCEDLQNNFWIILGGVFLPILLALILLFLKGNLLREMGFLILGFSLLSVSRDLVDLSSIKLFFILAVFFGILSLVKGIFLLAKKKSEEFFLVRN